MSIDNHFSSPAIEQPKKDPREDLYTTLPDQEVESFEGMSMAELERAEQPYGGQIVDAVIEPSPERENTTQVTIYVRNFRNMVLVPKRYRREWEGYNASSPTTERNHEASEILEQSRETESAVEKRAELNGMRIGIGTVYEYVEPTDGRVKEVVRVNNDYSNNLFAGHANPCSDLLTFIPRRHPAWFRNRTIEEIIPGEEGEDGRVVPYYPQSKFFRRHNYANYKRKALQLLDLPPDSNNVPARLAHFTPISYSPYIDLAFDFSDFGDDERYVLRGVSPNISENGQMEFETFMRLDKKPDVWRDPEFGSDILIIDREKLAQWYLLKGLHGKAELELDAVINGVTGKPYPRDSENWNRYESDFKISPPLEAAIKDLVKHEDRTRS